MRTLARSVATLMAGAFFVATLAASAPAPAAHSPAGTSRTVPTAEYGGGWDEVVCGACVAAGTVALLGGAATLAVLAVNVEATGAAVAICVNACRSAIAEM